MNKPKHSPEPWEYEAGVSEVDAIRADACVNACAGIEDPAAAIQAARETLERLIRAAYAYGVPADRTKDAEDALSLLTPKVAP